MVRSVSFVRSGLTSFLRGPEPPLGVPYTPHRTWRCVLGLHLWAQCWDFTRTESLALTPEGFEGTYGVNLDRPPDYTICRWCNRMKDVRGADG